MDVLKLAKKRVDYYALDLSEPELQRTLSAVPKHYQYVRYHGLLGTDDDGLDCLKRPENAQQPNCILSPGSSIGNFGRQEAASFLQGSANTLRRNDVELVGTDTCQDRDKFYRAYNDHAGKTHKITLHGLPHSNRLLGKDVFKLKDWKVLGDDNEAIGRNQAFYSPPKDLVFDGAYLEAGGKVRVEESSECSFVQLDDFWRKAGVVQQSCFGNSSNDSRKLITFLPVWMWFVSNVCLLQSNILSYSLLDHVPMFAVQQPFLVIFIQSVRRSHLSMINPYSMAL